MTAAAEDRPGPAPAVEVVRRSPPRPLVAVVTALLLVCGSAACTADADAVGAGTESGAGQASPTDIGSSPVPDADEQAIRRTIEAMNSAATAGVARQQETLASLVEPTLAKALADCAPATTTLLFQPTYQGLRPAPGWTAKSGPLTGTVYALPTLIRVYTGDRITGTDLTTLHFGVQPGEAYLTPLCVG